jgi:hypothetical protein
MMPHHLSERPFVAVAARAVYRGGAPDRKTQKMPLRTRWLSARRATWLIREEWRDGGSFMVREFISHDSRLQFGSLNHSLRDAINGEPGGLALMAHRCVLGAEPFWLLTAHSGQWPGAVLNWLDANDPKRRFATVNCRIAKASLDHRVGEHQ